MNKSCARSQISRQGVLSEDRVAERLYKGWASVGGLVIPEPGTILPILFDFTRKEGGDD